MSYEADLRTYARHNKIQRPNKKKIDTITE